jgi:hypothetical protein
MDTIETCLSIKFTFYSHTTINGVVYHNYKVTSDDKIIDLDLKDRYSHFLKLRQKIKKAAPKTFKMPSFPSRCMFSKF